MRQMRLRTKFIIEIIIIILFTVLCTFIEIPWWQTLRNFAGPVFATIVIAALAFFPGIMVMITILGIVLDDPPRREIIEEELDDITILVAAYNEEAGIYDTLESLSKQNYPKQIIVKVIDNNSKDNTKNEIFRAIKDFPELKIEYRLETTQGKFAALNNGLFSTTTPYVITIDADTFMYQNSILTIVNAITQENKKRKVGAIAGAVLVRNSRVNLLTKMQEWEYFLSIAGIKRAQGLFQSTLVAQGAFSIYDTELVKDIGGWKDSIGEDIVLTWEILSRGYRTLYEDCAVSFTNAPTDLVIFLRQRARWARGMIEGFRHFSFKRCNNLYAKLFIFCDFFLFVIDFGVSCLFTPGVIAAIFFHNYIIIGPMTAVLFPLTVLLFGIMLYSQKERVFDNLGLKIRKHWSGLLVYMLCFSIILSPACIYGYIQEFFHTNRRWK